MTPALFLICKNFLDKYIPIDYTLSMTGKELKAWRHKNGYSQSQLAEVLGITALSVSRWEREEREIPSFLHITLKCIPKKGGEILRGRPKGSSTKQTTT